MTVLLSPDELRARLMEVGAERYHDRHPFHVRLHGGKCTRGEIQAWALNRFYYQSQIPRKDAALMARTGRTSTAPAIPSSRLAWAGSRPRTRRF